MAIGANNLLMLALSNYRRKLFDLQTFQNQAHIISVTGIIIYFLGTYYLYTVSWGGLGGAKSRFDLRRGFFAPNQKIQKTKYVFIGPINTTALVQSPNFEIGTLSPPSNSGKSNITFILM